MTVKGKHNKLSHYLFTSESVAPGHPDKLCDQISDALLDAYMARDKLARVAIESFVAPNNLILGGEVASSSLLDKLQVEDIARSVIREVGYNEENFSWDKIKITNLIHKQSPEIAAGVLGTSTREEGAGDQGIMFGFASMETEPFMPAAIFYAHKLIKEIIDQAKAGKIAKLGPDGKTQVTLEYDSENRPFRVHTVVISIQHPQELSQQEIVTLVKPIATQLFPSNWIDERTIFYVNPAGSFVVGGPLSDAGLTGRKIIVDSYGGYAPHGGGAFSGKDPSKVDRSAAYAARYLAKNIVAAGLAEKCLLQISYAIGVAKPLAIFINTFETSRVDEEELINSVIKVMDLSPRGIRNHLKLDMPIYRKTATYGHFGRDPEETGEFPWEKTDLIDELRAKLRFYNRSG